MDQLTYDDVAEVYSSLYASASDEAESRMIFRRALARCPDGGTLIDIGCGDGIALNWLDGAMEARLYLGVDPSERMIDVAALRWPTYRFLRGTLRDVADYEADFVLGAFGPLIHIADAGHFAREIKRVLWPGGRFLVMAATRGYVRATNELRIPHTAGELRHEFRDAGLERIRVRGLRWLGRPMLIRPWADRCEWLVVEGAKAPR